MKRKLFLLFLVSLLTNVTNSIAQTNRPTATTAIYNLPRSKWVQVVNDAIYYVESSHNNAVMAIDRQTGQVKTVIPGIGNLYEGTRPPIFSVWKCGSRLMFLCEKGGIRIWDGKSFETSFLIPNSYDYVASGKNHLLVLTKEEPQQLWLWDLEKMVVVAKYTDTLRPFMDGEDFKILAIDDAGNIWAKHAYSSNFLRVNINKEKTIFNLNALLPERQNANMVKLKGGYIYASHNRRIYRLNMNAPTRWEEYAKIPPTEDKTFENFAADAHGNIFTCGFMSSEPYQFEFYAADRLDSPVPLGKKISTGISSWATINPSDDKLVSDGDNFVALDTFGPTLFIYNPNGLVGYKETQGKVINLR